MQEEKTNSKQTNSEEKYIFSCCRSCLEMKPTKYYDIEYSPRGRFGIHGHYLGDYPNVCDKCAMKIWGPK